jgi:hypothetical protein
MGRPQDSMKYWGANLPFPKGYLFERDYFAIDWDFVWIGSDRILLKSISEYFLIWADIRGGNVVSLEWVPRDERDALFTLAGRRLHAWHREMVEETLVLGSPYPSVWDDLLNKPEWVSNRVLLRDPLADGGEQWTHLVVMWSPLRRVVFEVKVDAQQRLVSWTVVEKHDSVKRIEVCAQKAKEQKARAEQKKAPPASDV